MIYMISLFRILLCRLIAIGPAIAVTIGGSIEDANDMNNYINVVMFLVLPFAVIPTVTFTSSR